MLRPAPYSLFSAAWTWCSHQNQFSRSKPMTESKPQMQLPIEEECDSLMRSIFRAIPWCAACLVFLFFFSWPSLEQLGVFLELALRSPTFSIDPSSFLPFLWAITISNCSRIDLASSSTPDFLVCVYNSCWNVGCDKGNNTPHIQLEIWNPRLFYW